MGEKKPGGWSTSRKGVDEGMLEYVTPEQARAIRAKLERGTSEAAAKALGMSPSAVRQLLSRARRRAANAGYSPHADKTGTMPEGFDMRGKSILYGPNGEVKLIWAKSQRAKGLDHQALIDDMAEVLERARAIAPAATPAEHSHSDDLLTLYPFGDPHIGLYTWARETGQSFNLEIAEHNLKAAIDRAVMLAPPAKEGVILNLGDLTHGDNRSNVTPRGGHQLDVDSRHPKVTQVALTCMLYATERALDKHEMVRVYNMIGNHDQETSYMISLMMHAYFRHEPRVLVDIEPTTHKVIEEFGRVLITSSHGEYVKPLHVPGLIAADFAEAWGRTTHRYHHGGHIHHIQRHELTGMVVESHRTLAPKDKHTTIHGWRSKQSMEVIVYHRDRGEIQRHTIGVETLGGGG